MARPIGYHRGQRKPWNSVPRINWDHPLTRNLISYSYDVGSGPIDLVTGGQRTIINSARITGISSSKFGSGFLYNSGAATTGAAAVSLKNTADIQNMTVFTPYTSACGLMLTATPATATDPVIFGLSSGASTQAPCLFSTARTTTTDFAFGFADGVRQATASGLATLNVFHTLVGVATGTVSELCYVDGVLTLSPAQNSVLTPTGTVVPVFQGKSSASQTQKFFDGFVYYGALWKLRALTATEARQLHDDPWCFLIYPEDELFDAVVGGASITSGTLATTEALDVAAFAGGPVISATLATTEALDTAAFAGSVSSAAISGTLATTEALDAAAFAGSVVVSGTLATTEAKDVAAFAGGPVISAALATTEALDVAVFAGSSVISAALATTEALDVAVFASSVGVSGTLATVEALDVAAFAGNAVISAALATAEALDVAAFAGGPVISAALATTEAPDVAALSAEIGTGIVGSFAVSEVSVGITNNAFPSNSAMATPVGNLFVAGLDTALFGGSVGVSGTLAVTEAQDVASFAGTLPNVIIATLAANEAGVSLTSNTFAPNAAVNTVIGTLSVVGIDAAIFNGAVGVNGTLGATETADAALFNGQVVPIGITGTLTPIEASDVASFNGAVAGVAGTLTATEAQDIAALAGTLVIAGQLAVTDSRDTAAFNGSVGVSATLGTVESIDAASFNVLSGIDGTLAATEAGDTAVFLGGISFAALAATEASDVAAFNGSVTGVVGTLGATEARDIAAFNGVVPWFGILSATEATDTAQFAGVGEEEFPADFANWQLGKRFDRSLSSRFPWQG